MSRRARRNRHRATRVGHAEREEAAALLGEHHADGRLGPAEFDRRLTAALQATTREELSDLFDDLPGTGPERAVEPRKLQHQPDLYVTRARRADGSLARPWYAQWWWLGAAAGVAGLSLLHWTAVFWVVLVWLVVGYPLLNRRNPPVTSLKRRRGVRVHAVLTDWEVGQVEKEIRRDRRDRAITLYRRFTGATRGEAVTEVDRLRRTILAP